MTVAILFKWFADLPGGEKNQFENLGVTLLAGAGINAY
jgi:hypothetical protein